MITCYVWMTGFGNFSFFYVKGDFGWLRTNSVIGAPNGSVWEYYFRTSLDHWSSFLGMIFALNFPIGEQFFSKAQGGPLYVAAAIFFILFICWFKYIYLLEKSYVSMSLHDLGKTTLETYLLQHHIWLTSNAKTLLTIIPGNPWVNFALATVLFFTVAKELYRVTMSLRGMILPDDEQISKNNIIVLGSNLWDALYDENDVEKYITNLNKISHYIPSANNSNSPTVIWLHPTKIITERLNSEDKTSYMSETIISNYRNALSQADELNAKLYTAINPLDVCIGKEISSNDGVYYDEDVYKIIAQMIGNAFALHTPSFYNQKPVTKKSKPKPTGSMSFPNYGIFVLIISAIMLVTFDAFLGVGFISLTLFNRSFDWEEAFIPLHKKLGIDVPRDHAAVQLDASEGEFLLQDIKPNKSKV
eukprot:gene19115-24949_t